MLRIREYRRAESLQEAYELNQKKSNRIIAGGMWLRLGDRSIATAIDLSGLGLNKIEETEDEFRIGCMVTLRELELHPGLCAYTDGAIKECVRHIVGVQFRNSATVGGSIYGRFGFSDILTLFMALDCSVELYRAGKISIKEFAQMPYDRDIVVAVHIVKKPVKTAYLTKRNSATDFPAIAVAVSEYDEKLHISIGARPAKAQVRDYDTAQMKDIDHFRYDVLNDFVFGNNRRGGDEYRRHVAGVLIKRCCAAISGHYENVYCEEGIQYMFGLKEYGPEN